MMRDDWLASYAAIEAVDAALNGIARRFQRYARARVLCDGVQELRDNYPALEAQFLEFFPELARYAHDYKQRDVAA
jgi:acyl carrier protein phosphodiesterase